MVGYEEEWKGEKMKGWWRRGSSQNSCAQGTGRAGLLTLAYGRSEDHQTAVRHSLGLVLLIHVLYWDDHRTQKGRLKDTYRRTQWCDQAKWKPGLGWTTLRAIWQMASVRVGSFTVLRYGQGRWQQRQWVSKPIFWWRHLSFRPGSPGKQGRFLTASLVDSPSLNCQMLWRKSIALFGVYLRKTHATQMAWPPRKYHIHCFGFVFPNDKRNFQPVLLTNRRSLVNRGPCR